MLVNHKGQITVPTQILESLQVIPEKTEVEFIQDDFGRWYFVRKNSNKTNHNRFRSAHLSVQLTMSTEEIMALTRN